MSYVASSANLPIKLLILLIAALLQPVNAESLDAQKDKAKSAYFSGELNTALSIFLKIKDTGDAESQYYLGLIYLSDNWAGKDVMEAMSYLLSAADQSNAEAMWKIGELYDSGQGVNRNLLTAIDWYRKSKQSEITKSKFRFMQINNGKSTFQSNSDVISKIKKSALNKDAESQFKLANIYDEGKLAERDLEKAFHWYQEAAINNHAYSMLMTGYMHCRGVGVESNKENANQWLKKSGRKAHCN